jgi:predicted alpha/beta superfamily hydrolase
VAHTTFEVTSKALGEVRRIHLYTPPGYTHAVLPVLYLLDGGNDEDFPHPGVMAAVDRAIRTGEMRPVIVVGIENTERRRDLTGPTHVASDTKIAAHVGGAAAFRSFVRDELIPEVERRVPSGGSRAILGESLAGLFVVETFFLEPALFDTYVAVSPSLWWNDAALAKGAERWLISHPTLSATLYLAGAGDDILEPITLLWGALQAHAPARLRFYYEPRSDLHHANIYETVIPGVIRRLWPPPARR